MKSDLALTKFRARLDARSVLTPEQLQKAKTLKHGGKGKMGGGMKGMSGGSNGVGHHPGS